MSAERCAYCHRIIPARWLKDMFILSYSIQMRKNEDGQKVIRQKVPKERCCRPCYFHEVHTNKISLHK